MADIRFKDLTEAAVPGADYWIPTDSAADGPRKIKPSNLVTKADIGLGNVDNTSDANKPISTAVQTALDGKATSAQGAKADSAVQPDDLGDLAIKNKVGVNDIDSIGTADTTTFLRGDMKWFTPAGAGDMLTSKYDQDELAIDAFGKGAPLPLAVDIDSAVIPSPVSYIRTAGNSVVGKGAAQYAKASVEPTHSGKRQSADGSWWVNAERVLTPDMFDDDIAALFDAHNGLVNTVVDLGSDRTIEFPTKINVGWGRKPVIGGKNIVLKYTGDDIVDIAIKFTVDSFDADFRGWIVDANSKAYCGFACFGPTDQADARDLYAEDFGAINAYRSGTSFLYGFGIWFYRAFNKLKLVRPVAHNVRCAAGAGDPGQIGAHGIAINGTLTTESRFVDIYDPDVDGVFNEDGTVNIDQDGILIFGIPPTATERTKGYARITGGSVRNARGRSIKMARQNPLVDGTMFIRDEGTYFKSGLMEIDFQFFEGVARNIKYRHETSTCEHIVSGSAQVDMIATEMVVDGVTGWIEPGLDDVPLSIVQLTYSSGGHAPMKGIVRGVDHKGRYVSNLVRIATSNDLEQEHFLIEANRIQTLGNALVRFEGNVGRMTIRNNQHAGGDVAVVSEVSGVALWDGGRNTGLLARKFTASLAGCTTVPTGDVIVNRDGDFVSLVIPALVGTSNSSSCVLTGVPVGIRPNNPQIFPVRVQDNGAFKAGHAYVKDDGTIELYPDAAFGGWTSSGDKGISLQTITYAI